MTKNIQVVLARRPNGKPVAEDFAVREDEIPEPGEKEALIQNLFISLDAGFRNWMDEDAGDDVLPAMALDAPVMGLTVGKVLKSNREDLPEGQLLMGRLTWSEYSVAHAEDFLVPIDDEPGVPLSYHLGILGDTGMSAYFGLKDVGQPKPGDTVLISAAGGAVGYVAGQVARIMGAGRVVGFAGSSEKGQRLIDELGYDAFVNYRDGDIERQLAATCPDGVDVYFDNVGGPLLAPVLDILNQGGRIAFCGAVSDYTSTEATGPTNLFQLVTKSAKLEGFMTHMQVERYPEARDQLKAWLQAGQLKCFEHMYEGVEHTGEAFADLFAGANFGKTVVKVSRDS